MIDFVLAGLVIGVVVFTLIVNHRKPDETEFIKQFELAREKSQPAPMQTANAQTAVLRLRRRDFRGAYTGRVDLANFNGDIEIDADLGEV